MTLKTLRKPLLIVFGVLILGMAALAGWLSQRDPREIAALIAQHTEAALGRPLRVEGPISFGWSLVPTLRVEQLRFANAPWGSQPDMLQVANAEIQLALLPLLRGQIEVRRISLQQPQILLETNAKGLRNWDFKQATPKSEGSKPLAINIARIEINQGVLDYRPAKPAKASQLRIDNFSLQGNDSKADLDASLQLQGIALLAKGELPNVLRLGQARGESPIKLSLSIDKQTTLKLDGTANPAATASDTLALRFDLNAPQPQALAKRFDVNLPRMPGASLQGQLHIRSDILHLEEVSLKLGNSQAAASMQMPFKSSAITLRVNASQIDLREIGEPLKPAGSKPENTAGGKLFSDAPLPLEGLNKLQLDSDVRVAKLILKDGRSVNDMHIASSLKAGRLQTQAAQIMLDGKPLRLALRADASNGKTLAVDTSLEGRALPLAALTALAGMDGKAAEGAPTDLAIRFNARGNSLSSLMAAADGNVRIVIGPGRWDSKYLDMGSDITELIGALSPGSARDASNLKCAVIRFPIQQGIAKIDNGIGAETSQIHLIAGGNINLRDETIDIGFRPRPASGAGIGLSNLAQLVRLGGPLSKPSVRMDAAATAGAAAEIGLAAATGGLSLPLTRLLAPGTPDNPCETALGNKAPSAASTQPAAPAADDNPINTLRRFFGK